MIIENFKFEKYGARGKSLASIVASLCRNFICEVTRKIVNDNHSRLAKSDVRSPYSGDILCDVIILPMALDQVNAPTVVSS